MSKEQAKQVVLNVLQLKKEPKDGMLKVMYQILIKELCQNK